MSEEEKTVEEKLEMLTNGMQTIAENMTKLGEGLTHMQEYLVQLSQKPPEQPKPKDEDDKSYLYDNIEAIDRRDFLDLILTKVSDLLDTKIAGQSEQIKSVGTTAAEATIKAEFERLRSTVAPDIYDWQEEMVKIANETPGISVEKAYKLARLENEEKARELDIKYGKIEEPKKEEETKKPTGDEIFGGLLPTSGKTVEAEDMTPEDAAEAAWEKVFGANEATKEE